MGMHPNARPPVAASWARLRHSQLFPIFGAATRSTRPTDTMPRTSSVIGGNYWRISSLALKLRRTRNASLSGMGLPVNGS